VCVHVCGVRACVCVGFGVFILARRQLATGNKS